MNNNEENFSIGIHTLAYHYKLRNLRKTKGLSQEELADECNMAIHRVQAIEQLKSFPTEPEAYAISDFFNIDPIKLFPKWSLLAFSVKRSEDKVFEVKRIALDSPEVLQLEASNDIEVEIDKDSLKNDIHKILNILNPKEQKVLSFRFGLMGETPKTLDEVGKIFNIGRERVRQVEAKALRKLRRPSREHLLQNFI